MSRHIKKRSKKTGLPPGALVHIGEPSLENVRITVTRYSETECVKKEVKTLDDCAPSVDGRITWISVAGVQEAEIIRKIGECFHIHPLILEDIMNTDQMTKMNRFGDHVFVVMKSFLDGKPGEEGIRSQQVSFVLGSNYILSFQEMPEDLFTPVRGRLEVDTAQFWKMGAGYLAYCLMDIAIDNYFSVLEKLDDAIYELEELTTSEFGEDALKRIKTCRRNVIAVRRAAWPLREVISSLWKRESGFVTEAASVYFSDIYDHVVHVIDTTETFREVLSNIFDIYLTSISNRINAVMKVLAAIATIILPMTLVTGLYGMNFEHMPELKWQYGYPMSLGIMFAIAAGMLAYFKKMKWF